MPHSYFRTTSFVILLICAVCFSVNLRGVSAEDVKFVQTLFVAPNGSDDNSGLDSSTPFATLERARDAVRDFRATGGKGTVCVNLASGVYARTKPFLLSAADSDLVFSGSDETVLSGGVPITGWRLASDAEKAQFPNPDEVIWRADLPEADGRPIYFEQLFKGTARAVRARYPNDGFLHPESIWEEFPMDSNRRETRPTTFQELRARQGDLDPLKLTEISRDDLKFGQFIVHHHWDTTRRIILDYLPETHALRAKGEPQKSWNPWRDSSLYYLENLPTAFDVPGEWFRSGVENAVYYRPLADEKIEETDFIAPYPGLNQLVVVSGDSAEAPVADVRFENIKFRYTDAPRREGVMRVCDLPEEIAGDLAQPGPSQFPPAQSASFTVAVLSVENARNVQFANCEVSCVGEYGLWFRNCSDCSATRSVFTELGAGAVRIGGGKMDVGNKVENCVLTHGGRYFAAATGVWIGQNTEETAILHNEISDFFYTGVSAGWVWGYNGGHAFRNRIEFNRIHDIGQGALSDMGGVYTLGTSHGTRVCNNVIYNVSSYAYGGWGLYPDEGSEGILFENNLVYDTTDGSFHQHYGKDNIVRNNILARSRTNPARAGQPAHQLAISRIEDHLSDTFEHNIIYWKEGIALGYQADGARAVYENNLWYCDGGVALFSGMTHDEWSKKTGKDVGGRVADPLFVDPDANDFRLKQGSPALEMGFKSFDYSKAGPEGEDVN